MYVLHVNPITSASWDGSKVPEDAYSSGVVTPANDEEAQRPVERIPTKTKAEV